MKSVQAWGTLDLDATEFEIIFMLQGINSSYLMELLSIFSRGQVIPQLTIEFLLQ